MKLFPCLCNACMDFESAASKAHLHVVIRTKGHRLIFLVIVGHFYLDGLLSGILTRLSRHPLCIVRIIIKSHSSHLLEDRQRKELEEVTCSSPM